MNYSITHGVIVGVVGECQCQYCPFQVTLSVSTEHSAQKVLVLTPAIDRHYNSGEDRSRNQEVRVRKKSEWPWTHRRVRD